MWWDLSVQRLSRLTMSVVSTTQNWKCVCILLCQETAIKSYHWSCSFSIFFRQRLNLKMSPNTTTFDTSSTPTPVNSMSIIFMILFFSTHGILRVHSGSGNFCFFFFCFFFFFLFRHLHEIPPLARCHHQWVLHLHSKLSLDLRAHCSAILVSRLSTILRKTMLGIVHIVGFLQNSLLGSGKN